MSREDRLMAPNKPPEQTTSELSSESEPRDDWQFRRFHEWFVPEPHRAPDQFVGRPMRAPGA